MTSYHELGIMIQNDDQVAFTEFYNPHRYWVYQSAIKMLHCPDDADEAVNLQRGFLA